MSLSAASTFGGCTKLPTNSTLSPPAVGASTRSKKSVPNGIRTTSVCGASASSASTSRAVNATVASTRPSRSRSKRRQARMSRRRRTRSRCDAARSIAAFVGGSWTVRTLGTAPSPSSSRYEPSAGYSNWTRSGRQLRRTSRRRLRYSALSTSFAHSGVPPSTPRRERTLRKPRALNERAASSRGTSITRSSAAFSRASTGASAGCQRHRSATSCLAPSRSSSCAITRAPPWAPSRLGGKGARKRTRKRWLGPITGGAGRKFSFLETVGDRTPRLNL